MQRCGLLSHMHVRVADQSWLIAPNESALHFKVVFIVLLMSNWEVSTGRFFCSFISFAKLHKNCRKFVY